MSTIIHKLSHDIPTLIMDAYKIFSREKQGLENGQRVSRAYNGPITKSPSRVQGQGLPCSGGQGTNPPRAVASGVLGVLSTPGRLGQHRY